MSHVDDGMLHAYLDGALSALDAVRVERHVAECGSCQQRLDTARGLIQRAARLLEWASPPAERAAPPLAALRPVVEPRWRVPVAWAATIVLALGAGIYGGQILLRPSPAKQEVSALSGRDAEVDPRAAPITVDSPAVAREANTVAAPAPTSTTIVGTVASVDSTAQQNKNADTAPKARIDTAAAVLALGRARGEVPVTEPAPAAAAPAPLAPRDTTSVSAKQAAGERRAAGAPSAYFADGVAATTAAANARTITADSARVLLGTSPVGVPDYPVTAIRLTAEGVVTVEHVIPPGRVIRVIQRRAPATEEQERAAGEALARYMDGLRVEIMGPMGSDSLSMLLQRVRGIP